MAIQVGDPVYVARGGKHRGMVESVRPGQILVRLDSGEASWVGDAQVTRRPLALRSSRPPASSATSAAALASRSASGAPNPYAAPRAPNFLAPNASPEDWKWLLFSFDGRIARGRYWMAQLVLIAAIMVLGIGISLMIFGASKATEGATSEGGMAALGMGGVLLFGLLMLPCMWVSLAIQTKRWHDRDKSGWWMLINFIPYVGGIWSFVECGCLQGTIGANRYGDDPLQ